MPADVGIMNRIVMAPKGMSADRMKKLREAFAAMQKDKTYKKLMGRLGENTGLMNGSEYDKLRPGAKRQVQEAGFRDHQVGAW